MNVNEDDRLWSELCTAEYRYYQARMSLVKGAHDLGRLIGIGLEIPHQRGTALRVLQGLPEASIRAHLQALVDLSLIGHSDIQLCREALLRLDRDWLVPVIDQIVAKILAGGGEEEHRRAAELYRLLDSNLLRLHLRRCAMHASEDVREIASDFAEVSGG